jgi:hypothetical protein
MSFAAAAETVWEFTAQPLSKEFFSGQPIRIRLVTTYHGKGKTVLTEVDDAAAVMLFTLERDGEPVPLDDDAVERRRQGVHSHSHPLANGQAVSREVTLNQIADLTRPGTYTCHVTRRIPSGEDGAGQQTTATAETTFSIASSPAPATKTETLRGLQLAASISRDTTSEQVILTVSVSNIKGSPRANVAEGFFSEYELEIFRNQTPLLPSVPGWQEIWRREASETTKPLRIGQDDRKSVNLTALYDFSVPGDYCFQIQRRKHNDEQPTEPRVMAIVGLKLAK